MKETRLVNERVGWRNRAVADFDKVDVGGIKKCTPGGMFAQSKEPSPACQA